MGDTDMLTDSVVSEALKDSVVEVLNETVVSVGTNSSVGGKTPSTPEGIAIAYGSLVFMALLPIFLGSFRSVKKEFPLRSLRSSDDEDLVESTSDNGIIGGLFVGSRPPGEPVESMSSKDAAMFPLLASAALLGLYVVFKVFSASSINFLLTAYFFVLGVFALAHLSRPIVAKLTPNRFQSASYHILLLKKEKAGGGGDSNIKEEEEARDVAEVTAAETPAAAAVVGEESGEEGRFSCQMNGEIPANTHRHRARPHLSQNLPEEIINVEFDWADVLTLVVCVLVGCWYFLKKHWIANNLFGLAFAINGVEFLQLPRISTGFILLGGLFIYDIFWVFGTDVMVTVAKSFEAPIKLVFPQDLLENGPVAANNFAMLGLGDIVIPGIFIALLLRFDLSRDSQRGGAKPYFYTGFAAYFLGLLTTIFVMHVYKHAQPALLYLVPSCLGAPMLLALFKGEVMALMNYEDAPALSEAEEEGEYSEEEEEEEEEEALTKRKEN